MTITNTSIVAALAASVVTLATDASVIASWGMTTAIPAATTGTSYNYGAADAGDFTDGSMLSSGHAVAAAVYSSPAGNGSQYSLSSNNWTSGDYYQVAVSTVGFNDIHISWDQTRSGTGPAGWSVAVSTDGGSNWSTVGTYTVIQAGGTGTNTTSWNATTYQAAFANDFALATAGDQASVLVRFVCGSTTAAAGTCRIDNIVVYGTPAPGAIALLGIAGMLGRRRR